jgi:hypothetical protein
MAPCAKREDCANYLHWTVDPRSEFNLCTQAGSGFPFFVSRDIAAAPAMATDQGSLF